MITSEEMIERMKVEIVADVAAGIVPAGIANFAELHNYVDPNSYGGAEELFGHVVTESASDDEHQAKLDIVNAIMTPAIEATDSWIKAGGVASMAN
jgi:hypothetical protein